MKLIIKINEGISIFADERQYIVKIKTTPEQRFDKQETWYLSTLDMCFQEIFDYLCKKRLADNKNKTLAEVREILIETKREILEIMRPFTELKS